LESLDKGGYARVHRRNGMMYASGMQVAVAGLLDSLGLRFVVDSPIGGDGRLRADFLVEGRTAIFVGRGLSAAEREAAIKSGKRCVTLEVSEARSDKFDPGLRVVDLSAVSPASHIRDNGRGEEREEQEGDGRLQTIFLDDPAFNFDYAHILPATEKCSVMHGHTSSALVEVVGSPVRGMVIDFNDAKPIIKDAISDLDHKLFISERYVTGRDATHVDLAFSTVHGDFTLRVPRETAVLLDGEATVENLAQELLRRIAPRMPENVEAVGVYVYEGLNKGTHLLARLHARGDGEVRRGREEERVVEKLTSNTTSVRRRKNRIRKR
jgi:6-pyruvoyl-tetrahydropterin synthase